MTDNTPNKLARMANQIGAFFAAYPDDEAVAGIAEHINRFWTRPMRAELAALVRAGGDGIAPLVARALPGVRAD